MSVRIAVLLLTFSFLFSGCLFRKPIRVEKEYYDSGNLKLERKVYKRGVRVKYYTDGYTHEAPKGKNK